VSCAWTASVAPPAIETNALSVQAASLNLVATLGVKVVQGRYLNAATATQPVAVLGSAAAQRLGIDYLYPGERIWVDDQWFYLAGILGPALLTPEIESSVLVGFPAAEKYLAADATPTPCTCAPKTNRSRRCIRCSPRQPTRKHQMKWT
jgi:putative ABC transport system permease protein